MLYTDEFLEKLRMEGDPVLDRIIEELFNNSQVGSVISWRQADLNPEDKESRPFKKSV